MRVTRVAVMLALVPAVAVGQAKPSETKAAKPAMEHDHSAMVQGNRQGGGQGMGEMKSGWAELDAFHALMMSVWHPAMKDSLTMARALAPQVVAAAETWAKSKGPALCDNAAARKTLPAIVAEARAYAGVASSKANDAAVKAALKKVHDGFETVGKPCMQAAMQAKGGMMPMGTGTGTGPMMGRKTGWKEFDALHTLVMSVSMAANKGDLKPAREKAAELAKAADAWVGSKGPAACDNTATRKGMPQAAADLKAIAALARGRGNDEALKAAITKAHDSFRPVAQPCMMGAMPGKGADSAKGAAKTPMGEMDHSKMDHSKMPSAPKEKP